jgi:hypothetical protein
VRKLLTSCACLIVLVVPAVAAGDGTGAATAATFRTCALPSGFNFFTSLKAKGVGCGKARKVVTNGDCADENCSSTTYGAWECHTEGGIAYRKTRCTRGPDRIIATASGD